MAFENPERFKDGRILKIEDNEQVLRGILLKLEEDVKPNGPTPTDEKGLDRYFTAQSEWKALRNDAEALLMSVNVEDPDIMPRINELIAGLQERIRRFEAKAKRFELPEAEAA